MANTMLTRRELLKKTAGGMALGGTASVSSVLDAAIQGGGASVSGQVINLSRDQRGATISPGLFAYLIEPYARSLDGVWVGEESSIPNDQGLRLDTIRAFHRLGPTVIRYPGGTFADPYDWRDGIGPRAKRPRTADYFGGGEMDNQFGTDEYLRFCELVGAEAWIMVSPLMPLQDTIRWMQYCNYEGNTYLADLRRQNGRAKPWGVKYWSIGNEASDTYSSELYADQVHTWTFYMRQADQKSEVVVSGGGDAWNRQFLARYAELLKRGGLVRKPLFRLFGKVGASEHDIKEATALVDEYLGPNEVDIAAQEWSARGESFLPTPPGWQLSYPMEFHPFKHYESHARMQQAVDCAGTLHTLMRNAKRVKLGGFCYPFNTWGAMVRTDGPRFHLTPNYHVFDLLKGHKGADLIGMESDPADGLNVVASASKDGRRTTVSLVNKQKSASVEARLRLKGGEGGPPSRATAMVLTGKLEDENTFEEPDKVKPRATKVEGKGSEWKVVCAPFSLTVVTFEHAG